MCEAHVFNLIRINMAKENYSKVYHLLENNRFNDREKASRLWDKAHYAEKEKQQGKPITNVVRFRCRMRYPLPSHIHNGQRIRSKHSKHTTDVLSSWLTEHLSWPYPNAAQKEELAKLTGISVKQVGIWFRNARSRFRKSQKIE